MYCHRCGTQISDGLQFCPACGEPVAAATTSPVVYVPSTGIRAQSTRWIGAGWRLVINDLGMFALLTLVISILTTVVPVVLQGPLFIGMHLYCLKRMLGRRAEFADLFNGFNFFVPSLVASLLIWLFTTAAAILCVIPGLIVGAMYMFTYLFILDKRMDFWPAMNASLDVVKNDYFGFTMFLMLLTLINLLGVLCLVVGLLVTIPLSFAAVTIAYHEIVGFEPDTVNRIG